MSTKFARRQNQKSTQNEQDNKSVKNLFVIFKRKKVRNEVVNT